ncbi:DUF6246 family protein [Pseudorhodoferax sp. Leaf265]|uniref:DUF6246 family protein n=1 Tax=Pseudorhodoferax sp. Leaf265 TaxID=1736315 RepID=UPI0006F89B91|nr:DUF6246 family protein [Pseudorhodoferax sp. Leaf265]KQP02453.1 hypothetical protein ASF45_20580 [Pseudorhodoferax sp. Leaf265]
MLVECGFVRACTHDGLEFTFKPSFRRISELGDPQAIVATYAGLFGPRAELEAAFVLACLCEQEDPTPLIGWTDDLGPHAGAMPATEQILIARHLMQHGIAGKARPGKGDGKFADRFNCAEYISAARVHLGLSSADAEALSMTEFQIMFAMKFPSQGSKDRDVPSREEYDAAMKAHQERSRG